MKKLFDFIEQASSYVNNYTTFGLSFTLSNKYGTGSINLPDSMRVNKIKLEELLRKLELNYEVREENPTLLTDEVLEDVLKLIGEVKDEKINLLLNDKSLTYNKAVKYFYAICYCALDELGYRYNEKSNKLELKKFCNDFKQAGTRDTLRSTIESLHTIEQYSNIKDKLKDKIQGKGTN